VLLLLLQERGERPRILVGTSAGAVNAGFLAANADVSPAQLIPASLALWESLDWGEVVKPLISAASLRRVGGYAAGCSGCPARGSPRCLIPRRSVALCVSTSTSRGWPRTWVPASWARRQSSPPRPAGHGGRQAPGALHPRRAVRTRLDRPAGAQGDTRALRRRAAGHRRPGPRAPRRPRAEAPNPAKAGLAGCRHSGSSWICCHQSIPSRSLLSMSLIRWRM
jgi:hypothetical protein